MEKLDLLWKYQEKDLALEAYQKQLKDTPTRREMVKLQRFVKSSRTRIEEIEKMAKIRQNRISELEKQNQALQNDLVDLDQDIGYYSECSVEELDEKAVQELVRNCEKLLDSIGQVKKQLLAVRQEVEQSDKELKELFLKMKAAKAKYDTLKEEHAKELAAGADKQKELQDAADAAAAPIPPALMEHYQRVKGARSNPVALLKDNRCTGCQMQLPSGVAALVEGSDKPVECENCGRILVLESMI